jgi:protein phosphatase 1 regulatory subunit 7
VSFPLCVFHLWRLIVLEQLNDNNISNWHDLQHLQSCTHIDTIYLERNPIAQDPMYRNKLRVSLPPSLKQIDATYCR